MGNFKDMLGGFATLASQLIGLAPPSVVRTNMPPKAIDPQKKGRLEFRVIGCKPVNGNDDELLYTYDSGGNVLRVTSRGLRYLTIQVKFEGYDSRPSQDALFYLERLGDRITWPSSRAALRALDMGLQTRGSFIDLSKVISAEDRVGSVGVKEFILIALVSEEISNTADSPLSWIETVDLFSNTLNDVDGTALPNPLQISATITRS